MDTTGDILLAYQKTKAIYSLLLANVSEDDAHNLREGEGEWTVVEILCHLRDTEEIAIARDRNMLSDDFPIIEGYDPDEILAKGNYSQNTLENAFAEFMGFRDEHLALLEKLSLEDWQRKGNHTEAGTLTIYEHNIHMMAHDFDHGGQIVNTLASK